MEEGQPCAVLPSPGVNFSEEFSPANLLLLPLPICWLFFLPPHQLRGVLGEKLHSGSGRPLRLYLGKSFPICPSLSLPHSLDWLSMKCLSFGPALISLQKTAGFPMASAGAVVGLRHPALAKLWGEEVLKEASFDPMRR